MKKINTYMAIAILMITIPFRFTLAQTQNTLGKVWERDRDFHHSDAGRLIQTYHDVASDADYTITATLLDDYSKLNLTKFDADGNLQWSKNIGNSDLSYWAPQKMIVDGNGNTFIAGSTYDSQQLLNEIFIAKVNSSGNVSWLKMKAEPNQYLSFSGMDADDDNAYLAYWYAEYDNQGNITSHVETFKLDGATGEEAWENEVDFPNQYAATLAMVHDASGIYQTGYISNDKNGYDILTMKLDELGNFSWQQTYSTGNQFTYSQGNGLVINGNGYVVVAGTLDYHTVIVLGYSPDGIEQFTYTNSRGYVYNVQIDDNENSDTYVAFEADDFPKQQIFVYRFNDDGNLVSHGTPIGKIYFSKMKVYPGGDGLAILGYFYDEQKHNYQSSLYGLTSANNVPSFYKTFSKYSGYNAIADFSTLDGKSFYLSGTVKQNNLYTDQMTSRWDVQPLRLVASTENAATISIYPNPCADITTIHFTSDANDVFVYDLNGRLETSFKNVSGDLTIATEDWSSGVYFVKIFNTEKQQTLKLVKE